MGETRADRIPAALRARLEGQMTSGQLRAFSEYLHDYPEEDAEEVAASFLAQPAGEEEEPQGVWESEDLVGHYRLLRQLGRGGQGEVHEAVDIHLGRRVAVKLLDAGASESRRLLTRFQREAELASKLDHPGICTIYETGSFDGRPFIAMQLVPGIPLSEWLDEPGNRDPEILVPPFEGIADALQVAHDGGVIHRDLKPGNVMVTPAGRPVILDFGLARDVTSVGPGLTRPGELVGTPAYMSPEQTFGSRDLDARTDVFSFGILLYESLTRRLPFDGWSIQRLFEAIRTSEPRDLRELRPEISRDLAAVVMKALAKRPDDRYPSAMAIARDLARCRKREPVSVRRAGPRESLERFLSRRPQLAAALIGLLVVALIGLGVVLVLLRRLDDEHARVRRLVDLTKLALLDELERELWPATEDLLHERRGVDSWLEMAEDLRGQEGVYREQLADCEAFLAGGAGDREAWRRDVLIGGIDDIQGLPIRIARMKDQRARVLAAAESPCGGEMAWEQARRALARPDLRARYGALDLVPQRGLVPLAAGRRQDLLAFLLRVTGTLPTREEPADPGSLRRVGVLLTLIPGDPPVFLSRGPISRAQWARVTGQPRILGTEGRDPQVLVPAREAEQVLQRLGVRLPRIEELDRLGDVAIPDAMARLAVWCRSEKGIVAARLGGQVWDRDPMAGSEDVAVLVARDLIPRTNR